MKYERPTKNYIKAQWQPNDQLDLTLYPYLAINFCANPIPDDPVLRPAVGNVGGGEAVLSVSEGGGAIAAPPPAIILIFDN